MGLKERIEAIDEFRSGAYIQEAYPRTARSVKDEAAQLAAEADELVAEMAEAITSYATAKTESEARSARDGLLKLYGKIRENQNE